MTCQYLGIIELGDSCENSGPVTRVVLSDPCYTKLDYYNVVLDNVKSGIYKVYITYDEYEVNRVSKLIGVHVDLDLDSLSFEDTGLSVHVDSGQCGFYDYDYFKYIIKDDISGMSDYHEEWYDKVCELTYVEEHNEDYLPYTKFLDVYDSYEKLKDLYHNLKLIFKSKDYSLDELNVLQSFFDIYDSELNKDDKTLSSILQVLKLKMSTIHNSVFPMFTAYLSGGLVGGRCAVSSSGIGDGIYHVLSYKESDGIISSFEIVYMLDEPFNLDLCDDEDY